MQRVAVGILIGELDAIARLVSVFFIATYGFLNLSASFEMIASPETGAAVESTR